MNQITKRILKNIVPQQT